ncbi:hypothetical protein MMC09_004439 [Bachmanniomyces sp. S44760]|nr:hypothetical protein [Bachmanniomyces sp. S44760]
MDGDTEAQNVKFADSEPIATDISPTGQQVTEGEANQEEVPSGDEQARIQALTTKVRDQHDLERDIGREADLLLAAQANERDQKRFEKTQSDKSKLVSQITKLQARLEQPTGPATTIRAKAEVANYEAQIKALDTDLEDIQKRIDGRQEELEQNGESFKEASGNRRAPGESRRDFLIRTGKITPFSKAHGPSLARSESNLQDTLLNAEANDSEEDEQEEADPEQGLLSHRHLLQPGFEGSGSSDTDSLTHTSPQRPVKRRRLQKRSAITNDNIVESSDEIHRDEDVSSDGGDAAFEPGLDDKEIAEIGEAESEHEQGSEDEDTLQLNTPGLKRRRGQLDKKISLARTLTEDLRGLDDGNESIYQVRLKSWINRRSAARRKAAKRQTTTTAASDTVVRDDSIDGEDVEINDRPLLDDSEDNVEEAAKEWNMAHPTIADTEFGDGFKVPGDIFPSLFDYQKTGVQWLWELYSQQVGGIIGDEMGLGKTIQIISFLASLHYSKKITKPIIVVTPATVMKQWVNEFHTWWPPFRVSILHTSGSGMIDLGREQRMEDGLMTQSYSSIRRTPLTKTQKSAKSIVDRVVKNGHVLITTYSGLQTYADMLIPINWEYAVLDEGHKIRNPNTAITIHSKELRTANRVILSGTPMQNNLMELWSLFDFVFPMRLGTLVNFRQQFEQPIRQGGYANASNLQVQTAMKCAETLKDTISPYLLQRVKIDVAADLPKKTEQVLFCDLTKLQRDAYEQFLNSDDMNSILNGRRQVLYGIDILRKICNHPDLVEHRLLSTKPGYDYGSGSKSGKMKLVQALLELWKKGGHKTLLFAQHRIMLDILQKYMKTIPGIKFRRMDGNTPITARQGMVDEFNNDPDLHVFLLTTKVGGLGVNLTGADRVIIYDPDWNPSTDAQAQERAWRLGQKREVQIYRLMTHGTIEEKIYHRQVFKQILTKKVLKDPKQRQTFEMKDLHDLFTLGDPNAATTETANTFRDAEMAYQKSTRPHVPSVVQDTTPWGGESPQRTTRGDPSVSQLAGVTAIESIAAPDTQTPTEGHNSDARMMESIFSRSGVHSALEHDQVINGKRIIAPDPKIIEKEAKKVAAEAAKELKKAEEIARATPIGVPTWTGQFGTAGRPEQGPIRATYGLGRGSASARGGPASSAILAALQSRQTGGGNLPSSRLSNSANAGNTTGPRGKDFMKLIRDYLVTHGGKVHTQMLIDHFNRYCGTTEQTLEFKMMLKQIATLQKGTGGRGAWVLKNEFRGGA